MRIASLVPSSTEMLFALGLGDQVVAVTHECDWPPEAASRPQLTRSVIPNGLTARAIDQMVRETVETGAPLYELDRERLARLDPELIVTQAVCEVCAVSYEDVVAVAGTLPSHPRVLSLDPLTLDDVLEDVASLGEAADAAHAAGALRADARRRLQTVAGSVATCPRPRVVALEWLDPPFVGGHWVPEMIELAGGIAVAGETGERSRTVSWSELQELGCDVALVMPCGYDAVRSAREAQTYREQIASLGAERVTAVDASAYFSRPGPRLVTGVELLAHIMHGERVPAPNGRAMFVDLSGEPSMRAEGLEPPQA